MCGPEIQFVMQFIKIVILQGVLEPWKEKTRKKQGAVFFGKINSKLFSERLGVTYLTSEYSGAFIERLFFNSAMWRSC